MNFCFSVTHMKQWSQAKTLINSIIQVFSTSSITLLVPYDLTIGEVHDDITLIRFDIDPVYRYFPFYDKIVAASVCEKKCSYPFVWLDVDSLFLDIFSYDTSKKIELNPVDKTNIGIPINDQLSPIWEKVADYFDLGSSYLATRYVETTINHEKIFPYYNIGMVKMNEPLNIFYKTKESMDHLFHDKSVVHMLKENKAYQVFFHQIVFSCATVSTVDNGELHKLENNVNYPIHLCEEDDGHILLSDLKTIRYDTYFNEHNCPKELKNKIAIDCLNLATYWYYKFI